MGRDKGLLPIGARTCIEYVVEAVSQVTDSLVLVGDAPGLEFLGLRQVADLRLGCGPLAGLETGLHVSVSPKNLVAACDMPCVTPDLFRHLLTHLEGHDAVVPSVEGRMHPLCAVYSRACLPEIRKRLDQGRYKVAEFVESIGCRHVTLGESIGFDPELFLNMNTPEDVARARDRLLDHV